MRIAVFVLICLCFISCEKEEVNKRIPTFEERATIQELESVSGTLQYYCEADTSFVYLRPDDSELPDLIVEVEPFQEYMWSWFQWWNIQIACYPLKEYYIQKPQLQIEISGLIKERLPTDTLLTQMAMPFVIDTLVKVRECPITLEKTQVEYPFQEQNGGLRNCWCVMTHCIRLVNFRICS